MNTSHPTANRPHWRSPLRYAAAIAVTVTVAVVGLAAPAQANDPTGKYDGYWSSTVSGCSSNIRVGSTKSIYDSRGVYYGWMEQRWSNSGACWGYQWVTVHITKTIPIERYSDGSLGAVSITIADNYSSSYRYTDWTSHRTSLGVGNYNSKILYAPNDKLEGIIQVRPCLADGYCDSGNATRLWVGWEA